MTKHNALPRWAQGVSGVTLLIVALAAGGLSLAVNVVAGLSVSIFAAIMFGLSDVAKMVVPIICQAIGWNAHLKWTYRVVSVAAVVFALMAMGDFFGDRIGQIHTQGQKTQIADQRIADLKASLSHTQQMASDEAQRGGCGPNCRALQSKAMEIETQLTQATKARQAMVTPEASGKAILVSKLTGLDPEMADVIAVVALMVIGLIVMELLVHLAGPAAAMIGVAATPTKKAPKPKAKTKPRKRKSDWIKQDTTQMLRSAMQDVKLTKAGQPDRRYRASKLLKAANG